MSVRNILEPNPVLYMHVHYGTYINFPLVENPVRNLDRSGECVTIDVDDTVSLIGTERIEDLR